MSLQEFVPQRERLEVKQFGFRMRPEVYDQMVAVAEEHKLSASALIQALIRREYNELFIEEDA